MDLLVHVLRMAGIYHCNRVTLYLIGIIPLVCVRHVAVDGGAELLRYVQVKRPYFGNCALGIEILILHFFRRRQP